MRELFYDMRDTDYGTLLVAHCAEGVCYSAFVGEQMGDALALLAETFPMASLVRDTSAEWLDALSRLAETGQWSAPIPLVLYGTPLQHATWGALLALERGRTVTYSDVATMAGYPRAVRAVASAVARNIVVPFVPCHRVVPRSGGLGRYSAEGGVERKLLLLQREREAL